MNFRTGYRVQGTGVRGIGSKSDHDSTMKNIEQRIEPRTPNPEPIKILYLFFLFLIISCSPNKLQIQELSFEKDGQVIAAVKAELAITQEEKNKGLMHRKELADGEGMLFVYDSDQVMSFWMKNTLIPLSIAYISSNGVIIDIKDMYPHDETSVVSSRSVRYALEVPQGWFKRAGITEGDRIKVEQLAERGR